jgi:hypothetical protein
VELSLFIEAVTTDVDPFVIPVGEFKLNTPLALLKPMHTSISNKITPVNRT